MALVTTICHKENLVDKQTLQFPKLCITEKPGCMRCVDIKKELDILKVPYEIKPYEPGIPGPYPLIWVEDKYIDLHDIEDVLKGFRMRLFRTSHCFKPFSYMWAEELRAKHEKVHWVESEVSLRDDVTDWKSGALTQQEKEFITCVLRLFTQLDVEVGGLYIDYLLKVFRCNEIRNMLTSFACREATHQNAYSLLNETLGMPDCEYSAFIEYKEMTDKLDFMRNMDITTLPNLIRSLFRAVLNEGVMLFAAFVMLLTFQRKGKMKGMGKVVEWSVRDENMHVEGVSTLFITLLQEYPYLNCKQLVIDCKIAATEALTLESAFVDLAFNNWPELADLKPQDVKDYIAYIIVKRSEQLGLNELISAPKKNPLPWVELLIEGADFTNFFENKVTEYETGGLTGDWTYPKLI